MRPTTQIMSAPYGTAQSATFGISGGIMSCGPRQMQDKKLVEELEEVSTKLDIAIEAGERGDWRKAEACLAEAKRVVSRVLTMVEHINDIDKLVGR